MVSEDVFYLTDMHKRQKKQNSVFRRLVSFNK